MFLDGKPEDVWLPFDAIHYEVVLSMKVDMETEVEDVAKELINMLACIGVLKPGDKFKATKCGDEIVVVKGVHFLQYDPTLN